MAKDAAPPTPVPMGDPKNDVLVREGFCASIIDTKRTFHNPSEESSSIMSELVDKSSKK